MLGHHRVTPSSMSTVTTYTPRWREAKWIKIPCLWKQRDGRGLNPRPQDPEFEVLTARPHMPYQITIIQTGILFLWLALWIRGSFAISHLSLNSEIQKFRIQGLWRGEGKSTLFQSQSHEKYTPLSGVKGHSHTLFKSQGGGTYPYSPYVEFFPRGFLHWLGKIAHTKKFP